MEHTLEHTLEYTLEYMPKWLLSTFVSTLWTSLLFSIDHKSWQYWVMYWPSGVGDPLPKCCQVLDKSICLAKWTLKWGIGGLYTQAPFRRIFQSILQCMFQSMFQVILQGKLKSDPQLWNILWNILFPQFKYFDILYLN